MKYYLISVSSRACEVWASDNDGVMLTRKILEVSKFERSTRMVREISEEEVMIYEIMTL